MPSAAACCESPWIAEVALRRVLPSTIEVFVRERRPMGLSRLGTQLYLVDRQGTIIAEFGPQYASSICRSSTVSFARRTRAALRSTKVEPTLPPGSSMRSRHRKALARRLSQIDVSDPHDAIVMLDGIPHSCRSARTAFSSACSRTSTWRRHCASACPASNTSICDSASGSTSGRPPPRARSRTGASDGGEGVSENAQCGPDGLRETGGSSWHVRNDTWWAWTSAHRRSPPSLAR